MLENKMSLLQPSSAFLTHIPCSSRQVSFPGKPSPSLPPLRESVRLLRCRPLSPVLAFSHPVAGQGVIRVPQFRVNVFSRSVAAFSTPMGSYYTPSLMRKHKDTWQHH